MPDYLRSISHRLTQNPAQWLNLPPVEVSFLRQPPPCKMLRLHRCSQPKAFIPPGATAKPLLKQNHFQTVGSRDSQGAAKGTDESSPCGSNVGWVRNPSSGFSSGVARFNPVRRSWPASPALQASRNLTNRTVPNSQAVWAMNPIWCLSPQTSVNLLYVRP